jgi:hypothetical protein
MWHAAKPGESAVIDDATPGFPSRTLGEVPPGDYFVQAVLNVYTECHRSDGHTIWAHMDQWEGQEFESSAGNLISEPQRAHFDPVGGSSFKINLNKVIPPVQIPPDSEWVKHIKFESKILTQFWGRPIYIGATILLPKDYDAHPAVRYPVIYLQGHFSLDAPFGFTTTPDPAGAKSWARQREEWIAQHLNKHAGATAGHALQRRVDERGERLRILSLMELR